MKVERYVYYRVADEAAASLREAAMAMQASLRERHPHLQARLLVRRDTATGIQTWMETYAAPALDDGVGNAMLREIESLAAVRLAGAIRGERHIESFEPCA